MAGKSTRVSRTPKGTDRIVPGVPVSAYLDVRAFETRVALGEITMTLRDYLRGFKPAGSQQSWKRGIWA